MAAVNATHAPDLPVAAPVKAPCAGRIAKCFADAGQAVEYGRPLFLLEPRA